MSFEDSNNFLNQALESIEKYLKKNKDEYGYYIKGKILISINEPNKAITYFNKAQKILDVIFEDDVDAKLLYRIGKTKEQFLNTNGISELYRSFIKNPRSICCARELKKYSRIRSLKTNANLEEERNELIKSFRGHTDELEFYKLYKNLLNNQRHLLKKRNGNNINEKTKKKIEDFIKFIQNNSLNLEGNIQSSESEENFDYYDSNFIEPDYDRDTFNALTDGQYGDYDEFDGDWDGLENWRGG
jgi:tetratricopeptide (TPR) repeat protein